MYLVYYRTKCLKNKLEILIEEIKTKYNEEIPDFDDEQKKIIIAKMKDKMKEERIDFLKRL